MTITLITAPQTSCKRAMNMWLPDRRSPLNGIGVRQRDIVARALRGSVPDVAYASEFDSAQEIPRMLDLPITVCPELNEFRLGFPEYEPEDIEECFTTAFLEGESVAEAMLRGELFARRTCFDDPDRWVFIFTHPIEGTCLWKVLTGASEKALLCRLKDHRLQHGSISMFEWKEGQYVCTLDNQVLWERH